MLSLGKLPVSLPAFHYHTKHHPFYLIKSQFYALAKVNPKVDPNPSVLRTEMVC